MTTQIVVPKHIYKLSVRVYGKEWTKAHLTPNRNMMPRGLINPPIK